MSKKRTKKISRHRHFKPWELWIERRKIYSSHEHSSVSSSSIVSSWQLKIQNSLHRYETAISTGVIIVMENVDPCKLQQIDLLSWEITSTSTTYWGQASLYTTATSSMQKFQRCHDVIIVMMLSLSWCYHCHDVIIAMKFPTTLDIYHLALILTMKLTNSKSRSCLTAMFWRKPTANMGLPHHFHQSLKTMIL